MSTAFCWNENHTQHASPHHPERPERVTAIVERLKSVGIWERLDHVAPESADRAVAALVHTDAYLDRLETATAYGAQLDPDTYTTHRSLDVAYASLGTVLSVTDAVLEGRVRNGFAAGRPPGHHATPDDAMGFCLLSNVAIAARWAQQSHGVDRVAIVDFDVHHGNGTQDAFYADPSVYYFSVHQYPLYPGTGAATERGTGKGNGATLNAPLPEGSGDADVFRVFDRLIGPEMKAFHPGLIMISAGFDAHVRDPLAGLRMSTDGFAQLTERLLEWGDLLCDGRVVAALEGGYDLQALSESATVMIERMLETSADG